MNMSMEEALGKKGHSQGLAESPLFTEEADSLIPENVR